MWSPFFVDNYAICIGFLITSTVTNMSIAWQSALPRIGTGNVMPQSLYTGRTPIGFDCFGQYVEGHLGSDVDLALSAGRGHCGCTDSRSRVHSFNFMPAQFQCILLLIMLFSNVAF